MLADTLCLLSASNNKWLLDSGATDHICSQLTWFSEYEILTGNHNYITILDGSRSLLLILAVILNSNITLHIVLYVPDFIFNLISVNQLCKDLHCEVSFSQRQCSVFH